RFATVRALRTFWPGPRESAGILGGIKLPQKDRLMSRKRFGQIEKQDAQDQVDREKLHSLNPVRFPVSADLKDDVNRRNHGEDFGQGKFQIHRPSETVG